MARAYLTLILLLAALAPAPLLAKDPALTYEDAVLMTEAVIGEFNERNAADWLKNYPEFARPPGHIDKANTVMSIPIKNFLLATDGGYKNYWDPDRDRSPTGNKAASRDDIERGALRTGGYTDRKFIFDPGELASRAPTDIAITFRPKYSFFNPRGDYSMAVRNFGELYVEMKPSVLRRTTIAADDTLAGNAEIRSLLIRLDNERERLEPSHFRNSQYMEAQTWGPLHPRDTNRILVRHKTYVSYENKKIDEWTPNRKALQEAADTYGFEIYEYHYEKDSLGWHIKPGKLLYKPKRPPAPVALTLTPAEEKGYQALAREIKRQNPAIWQRYLKLKKAANAVVAEPGPKPKSKPEPACPKNFAKMAKKAAG